MNEPAEQPDQKTPNELSNGPSENSPLYVTLILDETHSMQECEGSRGLQ